MKLFFKIFSLLSFQILCSVNFDEPIIIKVPELEQPVSKIIDLDSYTYEKNGKGKPRF